MENWKEEKVNAPKKGLWQRLAALAAAAALVLSLAGCSGLLSVPGGSADVVPNPSASAAAAVDTVDAPLEVHFIDVGQALSVLVECDGQFMLYDGGNVDDGSLIVSYLQSQGVEQLEYVFCSHAHEDHVGGLAPHWPTSRRTMCTARWPMPPPSAFRILSSTPNSRACR